MSLFNLLYILRLLPLINFVRHYFVLFCYYLNSYFIVYYALFLSFLSLLPTHSKTFNYQLLLLLDQVEGCGLERQLVEDSSLQVMLHHGGKWRRRVCMYGCVCVRLCMCKGVYVRLRGISLVS